MNSSSIAVSRPFGRSIISFLATVLLTVVLAARVLAAPVDINTADAKVLAESLNGVGPSIAAAIVAYRKEHGPFKSAEDLMNVKGVGPKLLERNKQDILLNGRNKSAKTAKVKK